ncbi:MAG: DUF4410 domain-containing protein [Acidobacteria bacterium]|nr:DUF4410 domain-containing protein [Acidobacteriota bacterium]
MRRHLSTLLPVLFLFLVLPEPCHAAEMDMKRIQEGVLDSIGIATHSLRTDLPILIKLFSVEGVNLGTGAEGGKKKRVKAANEMVTIAPEMLLRSLEEKLRESGPFMHILDPRTADLPQEYLIIEGRFLMINPGSRAKRYWVGYSAGKSGVKVAGTLKHSSGELLGDFVHMKHSGIGLFGGKYVKFLSDDVQDVGEDIGEFLVRWATGGDLEDD